MKERKKVYLSLVKEMEEKKIKSKFLRFFTLLSDELGECNIPHLKALVIVDFHVAAQGCGNTLCNFRPCTLKKCHVIRKNSKLVQYFFLSYCR